MKRFVYQILFPLTTAMIWGSSFVAQSESADHIGAFTFNAARCFAAFLALLLLLPLLRRLTGNDTSSAAEKPSFRSLLWGSFCCGTALALACNLQQLGMVAGASAGKTSFITTLYVVLVPICGLFLKKKVRFT